jgi:hypothetical protein
MTDFKGRIAARRFIPNDLLGDVPPHALRDGVKESRYGGALAFGDEFHVAVTQIPYVSRDRKAGRDLACGVAKADALDPTGIRYPLANDGHPTPCEPTERVRIRLCLTPPVGQLTVLPGALRQRTDDGFSITAYGEPT